jgi:hypothetical protein
MTNETVAMRLALLTRSWFRIEVVGPRTVTGSHLRSNSIIPALHILRCRLVDLGDRHLIVSNQHIAYRFIADPSRWLCPVCYAIEEDQLRASRTTHYPTMKHQLKIPVRCDTCREHITPIEG